MHISGHLLQTRPLQRFLHHLSEQPHNPLRHSFQMLTGSVFALHLIRSFPCCPNQHYTRQDSVPSRRNSSPLSACLPVPWNDNQIHDFPKLTHRIRDIPASEVPLLRYHKLSGSAFPLKNHRRPVSVYPDSLSSSRQSESLASQIRRLLSVLHLQL